MSFPTLDKGSAKIYFEKGVTKFDNGDNIDEVMKYFEDAVIIDPDFAEAYNYIGYCWSNKNNKEKAKEYYVKAMHANPKEPNSYINIAGLFLSKILDGNTGHIDYDSFEESIVWYNKALDISPNNKRALNNMGHSYQFINNFDKALECYERALEIDPNYESAISSKNILLSIHKSYDMLNKYSGKKIKLDFKKELLSNAMNKLDQSIQSTLKMNLDVKTIATICINITLPNIDYDQIVIESKSEKRLELNSDEKKIISEIAVPLKRNAFYSEAHNVYRYLYYRYGHSGVLFNSWFKVLACVGMFAEAKKLLIAGNNIYFNNFTRADLFPHNYTQYEQHLHQITKSQNDSNFRINYLTAISGNPSYEEKFTVLD
jgi:tetratricopeptide (TPR) repeat protein